MIYTVYVEGDTITFLSHQHRDYAHLIDFLTDSGYTVEPLDDNSVEAYL